MNAPTHRVLDDAALGRLHEAALEILRDPGVRITTEPARSLLLDGGCSPADGDVVSIPSDAVERALAAAPGRFCICDRDGNERLRLGEGRSYWGAGVTALRYLDPASGDLRDFTLEDFAAVARLVDALPNIDFLSTPGVARASADLPQRLVNQHEFLEMVSNTTKPLVVLCADGEALSDIFEMAAAVAGGREALAERPFLVPYLNPVSPLLFNPETLDKLLLAAEWRIPVTLQSAPQVGATSPVTPAGAAALAHAESLAGLVLSQLARPGTPFLTGSVPMVVDMRSGNAASGGPLGVTLMRAEAELARSVGLPLVGVGGGGDSKVADEQAFLETTFYAFGAVLAGVDMVFDVGSIEAGLTHSPEVVAIADEVVGMCRGAVRGFDVGDESLALDAIRSVGIGGHFLGELHTLRHFREMWMPGLLSWEGRREWEDAGSATLGERVRARIVEVLASHRPEPLPADILDAMAGVIAARRQALG